MAALPRNPDQEQARWIIEATGKVVSRRVGAAALRREPDERMRVGARSRPESMVFPGLSIGFMRITRRDLTAGGNAP
jgi:hypothetical protein